jgi:transcriptional regulator with XRE-family HTH domain
MNIIELLPQRLKAKRKEHRLTLAQVGEQTSLSVSFLSDLETGRATPSLDTLVKLAECYDVPFGELCAGFDELLYEKVVRKRILKKILSEVYEEMATWGIYP